MRKNTRDETQQARKDPMTRHEARRRIADRFDGTEVHTDIFQFRTAQDANECKKVLDVLDPGFTGEVFWINRLYIATPSPTLTQRV
jgi:hypothetical protein